MEPVTPTPAQERELDRVGAFSDGVFAIAITLLVLNIEVPHVRASDLGAAISDLGADFVAYGIGFAVIGLFWYEHHVLFSALGRATGRLVLVNTMLLASIGLMPFTTAVLGRYDEPLAVALYAVNVAATTILASVIRLVAITEDLILEPPAEPKRDRQRAAISSAVAHALVFLLSIPIAYFISESLAKWFWLLLLLLRGDRSQGRRRRRR
jgi:uncharacterized membrane protein